ncbi:MAG: ribosome recycling factor [Holosporales bacterium]|jgi:ribosome recycling factor|nr:ribosome recycling factor [Holosporales bacterium]
MADWGADLEQVEKKMQNTISSLVKDFAGIRTNRASVELMDMVKVEAYGGFVPLLQVGTVSVSDSRTIVVQVWDKSSVKAVEKAIRESDLGLNPAVDGQTIRLSLPPLSEERRQELSKLAARCAEEAKVALRNTRREAIEQVKKQEKAKEITEDDLHRISDAIQKVTDKYVENVDDLLKTKQADIMSLNAMPK